MEGCTVQNNSNRNLDHLSQMIQHFFPYAQEKLGFFKPVMVSFQSDEENANKILGRTAHYNPDDFSIALYVDERHPKDILRSFSHELVHHAQNCNGDFESAGELGPGYAQENEAMRNAELDAYKRGNIIFRDFEDLIKKGDFEIEIDFEKAGEPKMSLKEWKDNELNGLLMEKWGYKVQKEEQEIFAPNHYCAHHVRENISGREGRCVDHNWNEQLQEVTAYEVDFGDNDIRTLRVEDLTILEASLPEGHPGHMARKDDEALDEQAEDIGSKEHDDEEGNRPSFANKMGLSEDSGEEEERHYKSNVGADKKQVKALEKDIEYDKDHEKLEEWELPGWLGGKDWKAGHKTGTMPRNPAGPANPSELEEPLAGGMSDEDVAAGGLRGLRRQATKEAKELQEARRMIKMSGLAEASPVATSGAKAWGDMSKSIQSQQSEMDRIQAQANAALDKAQDVVDADEASKAAESAVNETAGPSSQKESITLDQARTVAQRIFERLNEAESAALHNPLIDLETAAPAWSGRQAELAAAEEARALAAAERTAGINKLAAQIAQDANLKYGLGDPAQQGYGKIKGTFDQKMTGRPPRPDKWPASGVSRLPYHDPARPALSHDPYFQNPGPSGVYSADHPEVLSRAEQEFDKRASRDAHLTRSRARAARDLKKLGKAGAVGGAAYLGASELGARTGVLPTKSSGEGYGIGDFLDQEELFPIVDTGGDISGLQANPEVKWNPYRSDTWNIAQGRDPEDK